MTSERLNSATLVGGALALLGVGGIVASFGINPDPDGGWGARIFPLVGSGSILLLGLLEFIKGLRGAAGFGGQDNKALTDIFAMLFLSLAYVWLMAKLGYLLSTAIAAPLAMWIYGIRNPLGLIVAAILSPLIYHLIFFVGLGVFPPLGEWFDLLDIIQGY
jgi:putative tricarboxylic transport membrane protein